MKIETVEDLKKLYFAKFSPMKAVLPECWEEEGARYFETAEERDAFVAHRDL